MNYIFIDDILENYNLDLEILRPDSNIYTMSLLQHKGSFHYLPSFFGNELDDSYKFNQFLDSSRENNASLVATPEYSCPWLSIEYILDSNERHPNRHKLWALGCESITPVQLLALEEKYNHFENIEIIYCDTIDNASNGVLLDPCCYIFKAINADGIEKTIVLIQFKTQHMGVWVNSLEQAEMISGQNLYVIRNSVDSINLITVICSDVMAFDGTRIFPESPGFWNIFPFIVLSLQMNPKPDHQRFKDFRNNILGRDNKDIITLNWSSEGKASFNDDFFEDFSKSNIAIVTEHIKNTSAEEERTIKENHRKGIYYTYKKPNRHCFYFSPEIEYINVGLRKPLAGNAQNEVVRRSGPQAPQIYAYDELEESFIEINSLDDGFQNYIDQNQLTSPSLHNNALNILDKERLISLSTGDVSIKAEQQKWQAVNTIQSFLLDDMETISRYTVTFDTKGDVKRRIQLNKLEDLNINILDDPDLFPDIIATFKNNCTEIMFLNNDGYRYNYNLVNNNNEFATVVNLGSATSGEAEKMLNQLLKLFSREERENRRVVVWYKPTINTRLHIATDVPIITKTAQANRISITKE